MLHRPCSDLECKTTGYTIHSPVSPSLPLPCITVCHQVSAELYKSISISINFCMSSGIHWGRMNECLTCTWPFVSSLSQKHCFSVCVYICISNICIIHHTSLWNTSPECRKITSILAYLTRWKRFTVVTSLLLLPQCVILCALLAGLFCFYKSYLFVYYLFPCLAFLPHLCLLTYLCA